VERGFKTRCENIAAQVRSDLGLNKTAPLPPELLAEHLGVQLWSPKDIRGLSRESLQQLKRDKGSWSAITVAFVGIEAIIYNDRHVKNRQSSDIMHELSHIILGHKPTEMMLFSEDLDIVLRDYDEDAEEEATWLSGCLLLPRDALFYIRKYFIDDQTVKDTYHVSSILLRFRMNITGIEKQMRAMPR
jgi:Zn-dependent peptidase ImmA (M78 family)